MIKKILKELSSEQHSQLMTAFENDFDQLIELSDDRFIGVNVPDLKSITILERAGDWSYGLIRNTEKDS